MPPAPIAMAEPSATLPASAIPPESGRISPWRPAMVWQAIVIAAFLLLGELPLLLKFFADLWSRPQYQFFPVALIAAGYIFWERMREMPPEQVVRGSSRVAGGLLLLSWMVLTGGLLYLRWMAPVSTWLLLAAAVWWFGGRRLAEAVLPAGILLLIIIPPPAHFDESIANQLRVLAVHASSRVLDLVALPHLITGTVIEIPGHRLLVEEACSGINSLLSVMAFTILYGIWQRRRAWFTAVLTVAAATFVLCANIARITLGAILVHFWKIDILTGTGHELLGMLLFAVCLGLVVSFDRFLLFLRPNQGPDRSVGRSVANPSHRYSIRVKCRIPLVAGGDCFHRARGSHASARRPFVGSITITERRQVLPAREPGRMGIDSRRRNGEREARNRRRQIKLLGLSFRSAQSRCRLGLSIHRLP